jgi:hypothetical protein
MLVNWRPACIYFWILKGHHHKMSINHFQRLKQNRLTLSGQSDLQRSFQQSAILAVKHTLTFCRLLIQKVNFRNLLRKAIVQGKGPTVDCRIPELMKFRQVIFQRCRNVGKSIWSDKAISLIFKPLKILCSSYNGVPLKFKNKNGWASSFPAQSNEPSLDPY